MNLKSAGQVKA